jgi:hypothetical protein
MPIRRPEAGLSAAEAGWPAAEAGLPAAGLRVNCSCHCAGGRNESIKSRHSVM